MYIMRAPSMIALGFVLSLAACGGGKGNNADGGSGGSTGNGNMCPPTGTGMTGSCTQAEITAWTNCFTTACDSQYRTCYGPNYKSGSFSGPCGAYITCTSACGCNDATCTSACTQSTECATCTMSFLSCFGSCSIPACALTPGTGGSSGAGTGGSSGTGTGGSSGGGGSSGTGATCADVLACCNAATNPQIKAACMAQYTAIMSAGDAFCAMYLTPDVKATLCP